MLRFISSHIQENDSYQFTFSSYQTGEVSNQFGLFTGVSHSLFFIKFKCSKEDKRKENKVLNIKSYYCSKLIFT